MLLGNPRALGVAFSASAPSRAVAAEGAPPAPSLPHWSQLQPGRSREYTGEVYDTSIVKRVYPDEVYGWEHGRTTAALTDLAAQDGWEAHAVPPVRLAYSESGFDDGRCTAHYAIVDGHHRLNATADAARRVGAPIAFPAMVTSRWEPNANGQLVGYGRMPYANPDPSLPMAWNRIGRPLQIHAAETVGDERVWGAPQITLTLPGSDLNLSLLDVADKLNAYKRPDKFLDPEKGRTVHVRITLQDVYGRESESSKQGDLKLDLRFDDVEPTQKDWRSVLQGQARLQDLFSESSPQGYPIIQIEVQQNDAVFLTKGL